jgi:hypothetical protein
VRRVLALRIAVPAKPVATAVIALAKGGRVAFAQAVTLRRLQSRLAGTMVCLGGFGLAES